jgi:hypothetical protein
VMLLGISIVVERWSRIVITRFRARTVLSPVLVGARAVSAAHE